MKIKILLLTILLLSGCGINQNLIKPEYVKSQMTITWVILTDNEMLEQCGRATRGCAHFKESSNLCTIYTKQPEEINDNVTTTIGHEVLHCFIGRFHDGWRMVIKRSKL